jgi:hypothetical protein
MNRIAEQAFFSVFFAIHLPPIEEGEFLLYIMLKKQEESEFSPHDNIFILSILLLLDEIYKPSFRQPFI